MQFLHYFSYVILGMVWPIYIGIFSLETRTTCHFLSGITIQFSSIFQLIIGTENKMGMFKRMRINRIHCWPPYHAQNYFQRYNNCLKN